MTYCPFRSFACFDHNKILVNDFILQTEILTPQTVWQQLFAKLNKEPVTFP